MDNKKIVIAVVIVLLLLIGLFAFHIIHICPFDAKATFTYNGHCYALYEPKDKGFSWYEAKRACESKGMHLATFTSEEEWYMIKSHFDLPTDYAIWIGYTDKGEKQNHFVWITGEKDGFEYWNSGEPNNIKNDETGETEDCAIILSKSRSNEALWNDYLCSKSKYLGNEKIGYICESE